MLVNFTYLTEFLPLIFCVLFWKKLNTKALKVFFVYTILLAVCVSATLISIHIFKNKLASLYILKIYAVLEYSTFALFFSFLLQKIIFRNVLRLSIIPFILLSVYDLFINKFRFNSLTLQLEFLVFIIVLIFFFFEKMNTIINFPIYQSVSFWICVGMLIYFSGNFFIFLLSTYSKEKSFLQQVSIIYSIVTIIKNILFSSSLFANEQPENSNDNHFQFPEELNLDSFNLKNTYP